MSDSFTAWVRANCPTLSQQSGFCDKISEVEKNGENFHVLFGARTTRSGQAFLVHRFAGDYFMFALSDRQAKAFDALGGSVGLTGDGVHSPSTEPRTCGLEKVEFGQGDSVDLAKPMKGTCVCRFEGKTRPNLCLRLETELRRATDLGDARSVCFYCYPTFGAGEVVEFEFSPLTKKEGFAEGQFSAAFLTVCTPPDSENKTEAQPISNAAGVLVTIESTPTTSLPTAP